MDGAFWNQFGQMIFRWVHVVAGVAWIGHLYFFNWVNAQVAKTYDADSKKKVVPELMPRALYWFRWGAAYTWITGFLLVGMVYYMTPSLMAEVETDKTMNMIRAALITFLVGPGLYDVLWSKAFKGKETVGVAVTSVILAVLIWYLDHFLPGRTAFIHVGSMLGTTMAMNVWMRIWPAQRKIIAAIKEGKAPDVDLVATAGLRSKHNTYMSVPLIFLMISNHYPTIFSFAPTGREIGYAVLIVLIAIGWLVTKALYNKSAKDAPKSF